MAVLHAILIPLMDNNGSAGFFFKLCRIAVMIRMGMCNDDIVYFFAFIQVGIQMMRKCCEIFGISCIYQDVFLIFDEDSLCHIQFDRNNGHIYLLPFLYCIMIIHQNKGE